MENIGLIILDNRTKFFKKKRKETITSVFDFSQYFFWEIRKPLSINNRRETRIKIKRFCSFFQYMKNWGNIKSREDRGESRFMTNTNISSEERRSEIIPNILGLFVN